MATLIDAYIQQLTSIEKKVFEIAKQHLETSFNLEESIGFKKWHAEQAQQQAQQAQQAPSSNTNTS